jgi:hypothetical protein
MHMREKKKRMVQGQDYHIDLNGYKFYLALMTVAKKGEVFLACYLLMHDYRYLKSNDEDELGHIA